MAHASLGSLILDSPALALHRCRISNDVNTSAVFNDEGKYLYKRDKLLGEGTYGMVYLATHLHSNDTVVIKQMKRFDDDDDGSVQPTMLREASLLKQLKHAHIVEIRDIFWNERHDFCLVFEHCQMDLSHYMAQHAPTINTALIKKWCFQMLSAVSYLHARRILHRDLKPQNILVTHNTLDVKIGDFGLGKEYTIPIASATKEIVTLWYRAPELLLGTNKYNGKIDVWSLGCIVAELARCGQPLFDGYCEWEMLIKIFQFLGTPHSHSVLQKFQYFNTRFPKFKAQKFKKKMGLLSDDKIGCDLVQKMLYLDYDQRMNAHRLLDHPWFEGLAKAEETKRQKKREEIIKLYQAEFGKLPPKSVKDLIGYAKRSGMEIDWSLAEKIFEGLMKHTVDDKTNGDGDGNGNDSENEKDKDDEKQNESENEDEDEDDDLEEDEDIDIEYHRRKILQEKDTNQLAEIIALKANPKQQNKRKRTRKQSGMDVHVEQNDDCKANEDVLSPRTKKQKV